MAAQDHEGLGGKGKCTMGWFYGFKLHLVINDKGEIIQWKLTPGNVDDREPLKDKRFTERLFGKLFADRGISVRTSLRYSLWTIYIW